MDRIGAGFIHHVAVLVRSIDASLPYYRDDLGMAVVSDELQSAVNARLAYLDAGGTILQLVEPTGPGPLQDDLDRAGECLHHVCFGVPDIDAAIQRLAPSAGLRAAMGGLGRRVVFLPPAPNGVRTELVEIGPSSIVRGDD